MLLDEITSELSASDERAVLHALAGLRGRVTVVMATHSRAAIEEADLVVFLGEGGRSSIGTHESLYREGPGNYRSVLGVVGLKQDA